MGGYSCFKKSFDSSKQKYCLVFYRQLKNIQTFTLQYINEIKIYIEKKIANIIYDHKYEKTILVGQKS